MILDDGIATLVIEDPRTPARDSPRPYLHPVSTPGGVVVSDLRPPDHDWHLGLSLAVANLSISDERVDANFWGGVTWVAGEGYRQLDNNGSQRVLAQDGSTLDLGWIDASGRLLLRERRSHSVHRPGAGAAVLTIASEWSPVVDGLRFGSPTTAGRPGAGYGGLLLRLTSAFGAALVLTPEGATTPEAAMGAESPWLALSTGAATVAIAASPANPVTPSPWFVRTGATPMLGAAPFFHREWPLEGPARWSWRVVLADGPLDAAGITAALA
ncbi:Methane oxygenase PmoA [Rathayibacter oskolensis]|uniref:Methane oxygenase PmoA n=1 Tax=Rathayibacter oskolensis TaxID=1891671 RepID=A0A1X7P371_9MICO|nr:PmoA family protein [Rathayibacter oskolensis]SMH44375.1 Methane oxygenase PmoA [Rathayibacter oskolensis]